MKKIILTAVLFMAVSSAHAGSYKMVTERCGDHYRHYIWQKGYVDMDYNSYRAAACGGKDSWKVRTYVKDDTDYKKEAEERYMKLLKNIEVYLKNFKGEMREAEEVIATGKDSYYCGYAVRGTYGQIYDIEDAQKKIRSEYGKIAKERKYTEIDTVALTSEAEQMMNKCKAYEAKEAEAEALPTTADSTKSVEDL